MKRILFILKKRHVYSDGYSQEFPSGLLNSAKFVSDMLNEVGFVSKAVDVTDNNDIDREVTAFGPDVVIIEALWVVPEKFVVLQALHPTVKWVIRVHSDVPFLAQEGVAVQWLKRYVTLPNVSVATNSMRGVKDIQTIVGTAPVAFLPNFYPSVQIAPRPKATNVLNVGCFGAIRPFKNQLIQAIAAIRYGDMTGKKVMFNVNSTRNETGGANVLKNLRNLFAGTRHELIEASWMDHDAFIELLVTMDISLAVSFTETFCIVAADSAAYGVPIVVSDQVPWAIRASVASTTDSNDIIAKMRTALGFWSGRINAQNRKSLATYAANSRATWVRYLNGSSEE